MKEEQVHRSRIPILHARERLDETSYTFVVEAFHFENSTANVDEMERGQDEKDGEDQPLLPLFWQDRFERLEAEATRVKLLEIELESERKQRELQRELLEEEASKVRLLEAELERKERNQKEFMEDLLRSSEATSLLKNPEPSNYEKDITPSGRTSVDEHTRRGGSVLDQKLAMDARSRKTKTTERDRGFLEQKIAIYDLSKTRARPNAPDPSPTRVAEESGLLLNSTFAVDPPIRVIGPIDEEEDHYQSRSEAEASVEVPAMESDQPLVASLVPESPPPPSTVATVIDTKRRNIMNGIKAFALAAIAAIITGIAVRYTRKNGKSVIRTQSPTTSQEPSMSPSSFPSESPSTTLFGFLAAHSFDKGLALSTPGSAQQKAMDWLTKSGLSTFDYQGLQHYALATLYFSTFGNQWISTVYYQRQRLSANRDRADFSKDWLNITGFCRWQGVLCNNEGAITSLQLRSNGLFGLIPAELAVLNQTLRELPDMLMYHHVVSSFIS